jgi:ABC-type transport system involved in multi-copper enzyme maturation permease subunit
MIWLTWRQHRRQALVAVLGLAVLAAVLIPTGLPMYDALQDTGLRDCLRTIGEAELVDVSTASACEQADSAFSSQYDSRTLLALLLVFLPLLAGMFWGATLVAREVEHGTHRLVWTQGVTRLRWLLVKGGLVAAAAAVLAAAYAGLAWWWITPLASGNTRLDFIFFDIAGLAPVGYVVFAVALGVLAGAVSRKVLPAMGITLVGFLAVRVGLAAGVRPRFQSPLELRNPVAGELVRNRYRGDWVLSTRATAGRGDAATGRGDAAAGWAAAGERSGYGRPDLRRRLQRLDLPSRRPVLAVPDPRNRHPGGPVRAAGPARRLPRPAADQLMIWLTWRQHRQQALVAVIGLAVLAAVLIPTGLPMYDDLAGTGLRDCVRSLGQAQPIDQPAADCERAYQLFRLRYGSRVYLAALLVFLPLLAGMFWGATLVAREVEHGTHRLVWTQGVTRLRWLLVKGGLVAAGATVVATAYALLAWWWTAPLVTGFPRLQFPYFDIAGLAPVGYVVFALALGVFAGAVSRKVLPAMAITLVGFLAARVALVALRPRFQAPLQGQGSNHFRGDWVLGFDGGGASYHPGDRFWPFQYVETGILVGLAALLLLAAVHLVRRRIS